MIVFNGFVPQTCEQTVTAGLTKIVIYTWTTTDGTAGLVRLNRLPDKSADGATVDGQV